MKILVLCTGNSCRSQMMHGWLQHYGGGEFDVFSAGVETHGVNPFAIGVMAEKGVLIHDHSSTLVDEYLDIPMDLVITVCDHAQERCPIFPKATKVIHHNFKDPSKMTGTSKELITAFRACRDEIDAFAKKIVEGELGN